MCQQKEITVFFNYVFALLILCSPSEQSQATFSAHLSSGNKTQYNTDYVTAKIPN
jgi:hypothetical protein